MAQMTMIQAITDALRVEMKNDENVLVFGEDVGVNGGVFRATEGLQEEFGEDRVFDTPLAESGIGGLAVGLALEGFRPVPEIQFFGFVFEVMDSVCWSISSYALPFWWTLDMLQLQFVLHLVVVFIHQNFTLIA